MTNARGLLTVLATACLALGCGGGGSSKPDSSTPGTAGTNGEAGSIAEAGTGGGAGTGGAGTSAAGTSGGAGGTTPDAGSDAPADTSGSDGPAPGDGGATMAGKFTVSAFTTLTGQGALYLQCAPDGTCFGNRTNVNKLAPNATAWTVIGNSTNGLITNMPSSMLLDAAGNLYTNACSGTPGVYKLPAGTTTWANLGTGLTSANPTSCNWNTMAIDGAGTLYVGFAVLKQLYKLPAGASAWVDTAPDLNNVVRSVAVRGKDVYVGHQSGVSVLKGGATAWEAVGDIDSPANANRIKFDGAGNLYSLNNDTVWKLPAGTDKWMATTAIKMSAPSDIVFDSADNGYIVAPPTGNMYALLKLPAGTLAWTKVVDIGLNAAEECTAMADDNIGHLIVQCQSSFLRSKP